MISLKTIKYAALICSWFFLLLCINRLNLVFILFTPVEGRRRKKNNKQTHHMTRKFMITISSEQFPLVSLSLTRSLSLFFLQPSSWETLYKYLYTLVLGDFSLHVMSEKSVFGCCPFFPYLQVCIICYCYFLLHVLVLLPFFLRHRSTQFGIITTHVISTSKEFVIGYFFHQVCFVFTFSLFFIISTCCCLGFILTSGIFSCPSLSLSYSEWVSLM